MRTGNAMPREGEEEDGPCVGGEHGWPQVPPASTSLHPQSSTLDPESWTNKKTLYPNLFTLNVESEPLDSESSNPKP